MCKDYEVELLGALPLDIKIREHTDSGKPTVIAEPDGQIAEIYRTIARRVAVKIANLSKDYSEVFTKIIMEND
jgi:ATP-binding protein involved in chromosome partitioning